MKKILSVLLIVLCLSSMFTINVFAENEITQEEFFKSLKTSTYDIKPLIKNPVYDENDNLKYMYNYIDEFPIVTVFFIGLTPETSNQGYMYLITFSKLQMKYYSSDGKLNTSDGYPYYYYAKAKDKAEMESIVFGKETASVDATYQGPTYVYQCVTGTINVSNPTKLNTSAGDTSISYMSFDEYYEINIKPFENTDDEITEDEESESGWFNKIWNSIKSIPTLISDGFNDVIGWLESLLLSIQAIPDLIADFFKTTITNEMGEEITITEYIIDDINENLEKRLFFNTVKEFGTKFKTFFNKDFSQPPDMTMLTLDFSKHESQILDWGDEKVSIINLDWYARYKPFVDTVISCFLWMGFMFMLWRNLPSIIQGNGSGVSSAFTGVIDFNESINGKTTTTKSITYDNETNEMISNKTTTTTRKKG